MKRCAIALSGFVTAALLAAPLAARAQEAPDSVIGFKLPPAPTATPEAQGPVVEGLPRPRAPRPTPTPTAAAPGPTPEPGPSATPTAEPPAAPAAGPSQAAPVPVPASAATPARAVAPAPTSAAAPAETASSTAPAPAAAPASSAVDSQAPIIASEPGTAGEQAAAPPATARLPALPPALPEQGGAEWWPWLLGGFVLIWITTGLVWLWRQRHENGGRVIVSAIERPRPRAAADADAPPEPGPADNREEELRQMAAAGGSPLRCSLEATRLSLTLLNVTLSYRLTLHNQSNGTVREVTVGSDLVTAHASVPMNQQIAGAEQVLQPQHRVPLLLPGQNTQLSGELRLPISAIHPLRRADAVMFVPLLRLRIDGEGLDQIVLQTVVIGQKPAGPGAGLRPFRLDLGPRIYGEIGHRLLSPQG